MHGRFQYPIMRCVNQMRSRLFKPTDEPTSLWMNIYTELTPYILNIEGWRDGQTLWKEPTGQAQRFPEGICIQNEWFYKKIYVYLTKALMYFHKYVIDT